MGTPNTPRPAQSNTPDTVEYTDGYHLTVDALKLNGVSTIYGLVGIPITDLVGVAQASGIRFLGFRHESVLTPITRALQRPHKPLEPIRPDASGPAPSPAARSRPGCPPWSMR